MKNFRIASFLTSLCAAALCVSLGAAEPLRGPSYIGMCSPHFPCSRALKVFAGQDVKTVGYLADAFGHECKCVKRFLDLPGKKYVRVHLANGTCFPERGRRCGKYDVFRNETLKSAQRKLEQRDRGLLLRYHASIMRTRKILAEGGDDLIGRFSLCLECQVSKKARRVLLKEALKHFPLDSLVDSPLHAGCLPGLICEKHGDSMRYARGQRCISDMDGVSLFEGNLERLNKNSKRCEAILYWTYGFNLLPYGYTGRFIPPHTRDARMARWEVDGVRACIE